MNWVMLAPYLLGLFKTATQINYRLRVHVPDITAPADMPALYTTNYLTTRFVSRYTIVIDLKTNSEIITRMQINYAFLEVKLLPLSQRRNSSPEYSSQKIAFPPARPFSSMIRVQPM